ncbi:MAG: hypothetical protein ACXWFZ_11980 [Nitrososphaeraceae archaeon]
MKKYFLTTVIVFILFLCTTGIQAQTSDTKLDQIELMKQCLGIWKGELAKDTIMIMNWTSYGKAIEDDYKIVTKDKILYSRKAIYGYDQKNDKIVAAAITDNSPNIDLMAIWFSSKDTANLVGYQYLSNPEKSNFKMQWILIPPDSAKRIVIYNNKVVSVSTFFREKQ